MTVWLTMLAVGVLTYATRVSFILLFGQRDMPVRLRRALRFVPPAVLTALIFPELLLPGGKLDAYVGNERLVAGIVAILVAWRTKNVVATIVAGMAALIILQALF